MLMMYLWPNVAQRCDSYTRPRCGTRHYSRRSQCSHSRRILYSAGSLVLFGAVQLTMFIVALRSGEAFSAISWAGLLLAIAGLVYLVSPGVTASGIGYVIWYAALRGLAATLGGVAIVLMQRRVS